MNAIAQTVHGDHRKEIRYAKDGALSGRTYVYVFYCICMGALSNHC